MKRISEYAQMAELAIRDIKLPGGDLAPLYEPIEYGMAAGGKRLRPVMLLMGVEAFGGNPEDAVRQAVGIEMFHNFTLLHDDVMDRSELRRGRPTVHVKWDENTAILSGDTMLTLATEMISEVKDEILRPVLETFNRMAIDVYEGQCLDMTFEKRSDVSEEEYIRMIELKTGALLGASVKIGALIAGASAEEADRMYEFGKQLGVAFQIEDDRLDTFGNAETFGKPIGGDILNDKKTYLTVTALAKGGEDAEALKAAMSLPANQTKVKAVTRIYERMGMKEDCSKAVARYSAKAMAELKATSLSDSNKEEFRHLVEKLTSRKK